MAKDVSPAHKKRMAVYQEMTPALQKVSDSFAISAAKAAKGLVRIAHDMGTKIREVLSDNVKYGDTAVEQLAMCMGPGWSPTKLYAYRDFAKEYSKEKVLDIAQGQLGDGSNVTTTHFLAMLKVKSAADRNKLWKRVFAESLSALSLEMEINAEYDKKNVRSGGRNPSRPKSVMGGAQEMANMTTRCNKKYEIWDETVVKEVMEKPPAEINQALRDKLHEAESAFETAESHLMTHRPKLQKAIDRVDKVLALKNKAKPGDVIEDDDTTTKAPKASKAPQAKKKLSKKEAKDKLDSKNAQKKKSKGKKKK